MYVHTVVKKKKERKEPGNDSTVNSCNTEVDHFLANRFFFCLFVFFANCL